ncbi:MAG TPA: ethanolamine ammonia-lyase subunit EutC [Acidobacteriaceae bacterium]|nr:ethanolamine ammonia-lyase subunit EutC [Acidobacteriaceae bacterium]
MAELDRSSSSALWTEVRRFTPARIGLGRVGASLPTRPLLAFDLAHAQARDAVHSPFDAEGLARELRSSGFPEPLTVSSRARDRTEYLLRPDLGRSLDDASRSRLRAHAEPARPCHLAIVVADGLSSMAPARHAVPLLREFFSLHAPQSGGRDPENVTIVVANLARVALGDEVGELLGASAAVVLIGERPGLSSPDSLGIYLTWAPRVGRTDAERNCISNIRPDGLPYPEAARRLAHLLAEARRLRLSGVALKDSSGDAPPSLP